MATNFEFSNQELAGLLKLRRDLENPKRILKQIGALMLADSQKAFKENRLGKIAWPMRYPRQKPPKVNVAGIIADFAAGRKTPPRRRFTQGPPLRDTGMLLRSLTNKSKAISTDQFSVEVGTTVPYAAKHQHGLEDTQRVTDSVKTLLQAFLKKPRNAQYKPNLAGLLKVDQKTTKVHARPFLGITDETERKIVRLVEDLEPPPIAQPTILR